MDLQQESLSDVKSVSKAPVVRGARACTVCRAAKMKCVGAEDGQKQCQRCKRANVECIFEKHRRGRKPGSKLSEASKMLRRLEKGLNSAKMKSHTTETSAYPASDARGQQDSLFSGMRSNDSTFTSPTTHFPSKELPPLNLRNGNGYPPSSNGSRSIDLDDDEEDPDRNDESFFPEKLIRKENERNSFFNTILNPPEDTNLSPSTTRGNAFNSPQNRLAPIPKGLNDPITAGIINEDDAKVLFDLIFLRLNPFINLFDPELHTVAYVRSKCPFLFTTLIMAGCKFFKPEFFKECQKLASKFAVRAFEEAWKRVEVVQAFACLTYWKDPDDNCTWTYIGYACRMAVELGLNRYVPHPSPHETDFQKLERRNRERTYLVLFVHDRSLSTQTGRHWMLPEDDLVRHSVTWHEEGVGSMRPEDVIVAAFVRLRCIAAETTVLFNTSKDAGPSVPHDVNYEVALTNCNAKLTQWASTWQEEMERAGGEKFHISFLSFFRLHVRLFLNSFGIQAAMTSSGRQSPSLQALTTCCTSALDSLKIVSKDFATMSMLRYGQDSITVLSAYSAVFLLRLLRSPSTCPQLGENTAHEIHTLISATANAYQDASQLSPTSSSAAYHARFLRSLVSNDVFKVRRDQRERHDTSMVIDPRLQAPLTGHAMIQHTSHYPHQVHQTHEQSFHFPASPYPPAHPQPVTTEYPADLHMRGSGGNSGGPVNHGFVPQVPHHASELDAHYWRNMFIEIGFGGNTESHTNVSAGLNDNRSPPYYLESANQNPHSQHHHPQQGQFSYSHAHHVSQPNYGGH